MPQKRQIYKIQCKIQRGMFDDEYLVVIDALDEQGKSITATSFADKQDLSADSYPKTREDELPALLEVSPMQIAKKYAKIVLPQSTNENGPVVMVPRTSLSVSAG